MQFLSFKLLPDMGLIKDVYSPAFYNHFADLISPVIPGFDKKKYIKSALTKAFDSMEWKERMFHSTRILHDFLPARFREAQPVLLKITEALMKAGEDKNSFPYIFMAEYVAMYGMDDVKLSIAAMEKITQLVSCEFAVRPFLLKYPEEMIKAMIGWSKHKNFKVRRLASEGSRSRLPWGLAIPALKKDPTPIFPILENLKQDPSEWVRKSVANNLNDIAKDNPAVVLDIAKKWKGLGKETDAIIKHGSRTLLKQGHSEILSHFGLNSKHLSIADFRIITPRVKMGDSVEFSVSITNKHSKKQSVRLEYAIYYMKSNGKQNKKVFKISEKDYAPGETISVTRKHSFKPITTRVFYAGEHHISVILNGTEMEKSSFILKEKGR